MFSLNRLYKFDTLAPAILGVTYDDMKVLAIMSAREAIKIRDIVSLHESVINVIPALPTDINDLTWVLFENSSGEKIVLAEEYIDPNTVVLVEKINLRISIYDIDNIDKTIIRNRLLELGYNNIKIEKF